MAALIENKIKYKLFLSERIWKKKNSDKKKNRKKGISECGFRVNHKLRGLIIHNIVPKIESRYEKNSLKIKNRVMALSP